LQPSKTKKRLFIGFAIQLSMMLLLILISLLAMNAINGRLETIAKNNLIKVEIASDMLHAARERSILLHRIVLLDDPFERDELGLRLDAYGTEFGNNRIKLKELQLSDAETAILEEQGRLTGIAIPLQRKVVDLAATDELKQAKEALINDAMPAQDNVLGELKKLIQLQKKYADQASSIATETYEKSRLIMLILGIAMILLGIFIARIFINRITQAEHDLHNEKEKALVTFRSIGDAVITTDSEGMVEYINEKAESLTGLYSIDAIGRPIGSVFKAYDTDNKKYISEFIFQYLSGNVKEQISRNVDLLSFDEINYNISVAISPIMGDDQALIGIVITFHDITKSRELMRRIEYHASHDALTGLLNRREFEYKVKQSLTLYERDTSHAFCVIDLDRFKTVNDACGHQAGDELLRQLSTIMKAVIRKGDLMARIGGDEFAVFLSNINTERAVILANELLESINNFRFLWKDKTFRISASIGLVDASPELSDYDYLYHSADTACYIAKNEGRSRIHVMSIEDSVLAKKKEETDWITKLNKALDEDEFYLFSQKTMPLSLRAEGRQYVEILIRMRDSEQSYILPMSFIPTAERYGLMQRIDHFVLSRICHYINDTPLDSVVYAVNLSGQTLSSVSAMEKLIGLVKGSNLPAGRLCLEVTETVAIANLDNARVFMSNMQEMGCYTALDDFGSGLSSFSYLKNLPLDFIKIDGIFVSQMLEDKASAIMVDAIHSIGKKLGLMTIAEYVENEETARFLREIGVDLGQGYLFGKPELFVSPPADSP
jgi:diguanylate cyclase (GGDEF)-like protein/PAS domain S-box-containing protein